MFPFRNYGKITEKLRKGFPEDCAVESDRLDGHYLREIKGGAESQKFYAIPVPDDCETKIKLQQKRQANTIV